MGNCHGSLKMSLPEIIVIGRGGPERQQCEGVVVGAGLAFVAGDEGMQRAETGIIISRLHSQYIRGGMRAPNGPDLMDQKCC
jgi:hypothetical protein